MATIILASASLARARLLADAGIAATAIAAGIDEDAMKRAHRAAGSDAAACAAALAAEKARAVSCRHPGALVIGADQMLVLEGAWFDKPKDRVEAAEQLRRLRGRTHELVTAACVVRAGERLWSIVECPRLTMREFSDAFLEHYLAEVDADALASVGAYQIERRGIQLFASIEGDHAAILGLPLLPLLDCLRELGAVAR
jgi:septum formation protein